MVLSLGSLGAVWPARLADVGVPGSPVLESPDFATLELRDAWDMSQYSDVSQFLNDSGTKSIVANPAVANGLFTGQSVGNAGNGNTAHFYPLFPGYPDTMHLGKVGQRYPIDSSTYHCLYIGMQVNSPTGADQFRVFWFADDRLNGGGAQWGGLFAGSLYPESPSSAPTPGFRVYRVDLSAVTQTDGNTNWKDRATWQGLRIDPTSSAGVNFSVDWVRLTDCAANNQEFTWTIGDVTSLWLEAAGTTHFVRIANGLSGNSADVDLEGVPPGSYTVGVSDNHTTCCTDMSSTPLVINQTPIVDFLSPAFTSGPDFATQAGGPWDFDNPADINRQSGLSTSFGGGLLDTTTQSGPLPGGTDAQFYMRWPQPATPANYPYLSFRLLTEWNHPWQNTPAGMIARITWLVQGNAGTGSRCYSVSQAIPLDIGWQNYFVDLSDAYNGSTVGQAGNCAGDPNWSASPDVVDLRFDPNENVSVALNPPGGGGAFHQVFDWMRLTSIDQVTAGKIYPVRLSINRGVSQLNVYYTTDRLQPTQHQAHAPSSVAGTPGFVIFVPLMRAGGQEDPPGLPPVTNTFSWDTTGVSPNTYYICVAATGGGNSATYCSDAPVRVQ